MDEEQGKLIADLRRDEEESLTQSTADEIGVPYKDLTGVTINTDALRMIDEPVARKAEMAAFAMVGKKLDVAVKSPTNQEVVNELSRLEELGYETTIYMVSSRSLEKAFGRYNDISASEVSRGGLLDISDENLQRIASEVHNNTDVKTRLDQIFTSKDSHEISEIMEIVFGSAIALRSSDVHFEPEETFTRIRFREDGVLQEIIQMDPMLYGRLLNRIKFISGMKLSNSEIAQDGRFTIFYKKIEMEVRVATAPGAYQESIVLRILNPEGLAVDFEKLGIEPKLFKIFEKEIAKPNGMILTTGPTGSGKTTTLYSFLKRIYDPGIKIITIEDPIEYHLPGITQEQVSHDKGFDFLAGLRAALRQDPEVIMVGEIRDKETATIAVNASLTGHMVFSTLHTNSAAGTIPRLLDLGIQPGILAAALTVSIGQRMVRRLCPICKKQGTLDPEKTQILRNVIKHAEDVGKDFATYGISSGMNFITYDPVGCDNCNQTGYKGRVGLFEAILTDDVIAKEMTKTPPPTDRDIKRAAEHQKILTLIEDGVVKILTGMSSYDEVQSVVDLNEDLENNAEIAAETIGQEPVTNNSEQNQSLNHMKSVDIGQSQPSAQPIINQNSGEEVALLIDYLKLLESLQQKNPEVAISDKIARSKDMIVSILENTPNLESLFANVNPAVTVRDQIEGLMNELGQLETDQAKNPNMNVANQIAGIRNTIQKMRSEVVV